MQTQTCSCNKLDLQQLVTKAQASGGTIIELLQDIQAHYNYLPQDVMTQLAVLTDVPLGRIVSIATFYKAFALEQRGRCRLHVCVGTACHVSGAPRVLERLESELGIAAGHGTAEDGLFSIDCVRCIGACSLAPVIVAGDRTFGKVTPSDIPGILQELREEYGSSQMSSRELSVSGSR